MAWQAVAAVAGIGASLWGTHQASNAAKDQAEAQNEAALAQYGYNLEKYELDKDKIDADREHALDLYEIRLRNEQKSAQWRDDINNQKYLYDLQIRNQQQSSLDTQFAKSNKLYGYQTTLNEQVADAALENELIKLNNFIKSWCYEVFDIETIINKIDNIGGFELINNKKFIKPSIHWFNAVRNSSLKEYHNARTSSIPPIRGADFLYKKI